MGQQIRKEIIGLLSRTSNTNVSLGQSVLNIGGQQYSTQGNLLMNISTSGFGGLDTGSVAASKTYHLYAVINNAGAVGLVSSLNLPMANGPVGFPNWKYLWSIHTDLSNFILDFERVGKKNVFKDSLSGSIEPDLLAFNQALTIDTSGAGDAFPQNTDVPSNNFAFTSNMLNGIADVFQGTAFVVGDGGNAEWTFQIYELVGGNLSSIVLLSQKQVSGGKFALVPYEGKVGGNYVVRFTTIPSMTTRIVQNQILSYDNKLVDESSSAGTTVNIGQNIPGPINELWLRNANGYGSTNLYQKRWSTVQINLGTAFTFKDDPVAGSTITINEDGLYAFSLTEETNSNSQFGITLNQTSPILPITSIVDGSEVLNCSYTVSASLFMTCTGVKFLHAGDVLRTVSDAAGPGPYAEVVGFRIEKLANVGLQGVVSIGPRSEVFVYGGAGHGSVDTFVRRFATLVSIIGTDISYTSNASNGSFFTINTPGLYCISYTDASSSGADAGVTKNSPHLTTAVADPSNDAYRLFAVSVSGAGANQTGGMSTTLFCNAGDVIRAQNDSSSTPDGTANNGTTFRVTKVNN